MGISSREYAGSRTESYDDIFKSMRSSPLILILTLYTLVGMIIASLLFFYHFYLMFSLNTTANELKRIYSVY